jgi:hypothetical protein
MDPSPWAVYPDQMPSALGAIAIDSGTVLILITLLVTPIAAIAFARSGPAWNSIGKGPLAMEKPAPEAESSAEQDDAQLRLEVRQLVEAGNERRARHGEPPLDVGEETERRLADLIGSGR